MTPTYSLTSAYKPLQLPSVTNSCFRENGSMAHIPVLMVRPFLQTMYHGVPTLALWGYIPSPSNSQLGNLMLHGMQWATRQIFWRYSPVKQDRKRVILIRSQLAFFTVSLIMNYHITGICQKHPKQDQLSRDNYFCNKKSLALEGTL